MLSSAARNSATFLRTLPFPLCCGTFPRTAQPPFSNFRPLSTSRHPLPSLEDILKRKATQKPDDAPTINTANPSPPPNGQKTRRQLSRDRPPRSDLLKLEADIRGASPHVRQTGSQLFLGQLPPGDTVELEGKIREAFSSFGEVPIIRVGARLDGKKYAHLEYKSPEAALEVLRITQETPVSISNTTISVRLAGKAPEFTHHTLFFTGFRGTHDDLKRALWVKGYRDPSVLFFLRSHSKWGREGRIDFPTRVNIKDAFRKLNGLKIDERTTLNLSHNPPGSSPPAESEPRLTILLVGNLPNYISETELEDRVWTFFERRAAITSVELDVSDDGTPQRFCYVRFVNPIDALRVSESLAKDPLILDDLKTTATLIPQPGLYRILFLRKYKGTKQGLERAFAEYLDSGRLKMIHLTHDKGTGKPNGSGVIKFTLKADAAEALMELNGHDVEGWKLNMRFYKHSAQQGQNTAPLKEQEVLREPEVLEEQEEVPKEQEALLGEPEIAPSQSQARTGSSIKDFDIWRPLGG